MLASNNLLRTNNVVTLKRLLKMENKNKLEDLISVYSLIRNEDKVELIVSDTQIILDLGYHCFTSNINRIITDEYYKRFYVFIINTLFFN
jgi:hypothetical protein